MYVSNTFNIFAITLLAICLQTCSCRSLDVTAADHELKRSVTGDRIVTARGESVVSGRATLPEDYDRSSEGGDYHSDDWGYASDYRGTEDSDDQEAVQSSYLGYDEDEDEVDLDDMDELDYFNSLQIGKGITTTAPPEAWKINQETTADAMKNSEGERLFEGDIILDPITRLRMEVDRMPSRKKRAVKKAAASRWINGTIPYIVSSELPYSTRKEIRKAIRHWRKRTCLRFRPRRHTDPDYINFVGDEGCWSNVGRMGGEQKISIGRGCRQRGTIIHEIGHAIGFWHEQARRDRDIYIRILKENIQDEHKTQFRRMPGPWMNSMGYAYDYWSIMHYGPDFFSKNHHPTIKIRKIGRRIGARIGQRYGLSHLDIAQANAMYKCNKLPPKKKECFRGNNGRDYRGKLDYTEQGVTCQHWTSQWPHGHRENLYESRDGLGKHNRCRNPGGRRKRPWCYTTLTHVKWQYCDIQACDSN